MSEPTQLKINDPSGPIVAPVTNGNGLKRHFIDCHVDKLLVAALIILTYGGILLLVKWNADSQIITFATTTVSGLVGALVALMTGRNNSNGSS